MFVLYYNNFTFVKCQACTFWALSAYLHVKDDKIIVVVVMYFTISHRKAFSELAQLSVAVHSEVTVLFDICLLECVRSWCIFT